MRVFSGTVLFCYISVYSVGVWCTVVQIHVFFDTALFIYIYIYIYIYLYIVCVWCTVVQLRGQPAADPSFAVA